MATATERFLALVEAVKYLESAVDHLSEHIGRPEWIEDDDGKRFRYAKPSPQILQLCKAVRIVSGLSGCLALFQSGHYTEIMMLLRCVNDFSSEVLFMDEMLETGKPTVDQQKFLDNFFAEGSIYTREAFLAKVPRGSVVNRSKFHASHGRLLTPENRYDTEKAWAADDAVFAGYIHGSYSSVMEMYEGGTWAFLMHGMLATDRPEPIQLRIAYAVHLAYNALHAIGWSAGDECVLESSRAGLLAFEQSAACEGMNL